MGEPPRLDAAPRQADASARALIHRAAYGIFRSRLDGTLVKVNPALARMLGYESATNLLAVNLVTDVYRDPYAHAQVVEHLQAGDRPDGIEVEWKRKDGTPITVRLSGWLVQARDGSLDGLEAFVEDVTERRRQEEHLRHTHQLEAVERLAGGVAHEFNNLLMIMTGRSELLRESLHPDDPALRHLTIIQDTARRAAALIQQLLAFGQTHTFEPQTLDPDALIADLIPMLRALLGEDIELVVVPRSRRDTVHGDPRFLQQALMNLALNAREAMPQGGRLTIQAANIEIDEAFPPHPGVRPGPHVVLAVSDTGVGMDQETRARIFEPFFTTKEVGEGPGLGLSAVYGIVKQHKGNLVVESVPGRGSSFKIYLPRMERDTTQAGDPREALRPAPKGSETVLLVEDEAAVRAVTQESLLVHGYNVLEAADPADALRICEHHRQPIHLLLTDVVMPGLSGPDLARRLASLRPDMKVLYMSGYDQPTLGHHGISDDAAVLHKPFSATSLARRVRELLDQCEPRR